MLNACVKREHRHISVINFLLSASNFPETGGMRDLCRVSFSNLLVAPDCKFTSRALSYVHLNGLDAHSVLNRRLCRFGPLQHPEASACQSPSGRRNDGKAGSMTRR